MSAPKTEDALLLIRCPSCGQRFKVGEDLMRRTVECGNCEHRFRISEDVIVRGKKMYPGERKDAALGRFQRFPLNPGGGVQKIDAVQYGQAPDPSFYEPTPPLRIVAAAAGVVVMILIGMLLILGADHNAPLDGIPTERRLIMAGFAAVLGSALLLYGNRKARGKAAVFSLLASAALLSLPYIFNKASEPLGSTRVLVEPADQEEEVEEEKPVLTGVDLLKEQIGVDPLEQEIERLRKEGSPNTAIGLWLRNLSASNRFLVRDFVLRTLDADHQSHYYPRGGDDYLMVVTGVSMSLKNITEAVGPLGEVENVYPDLSVIEVLVNNTNFVEGPIDKLNNKKDPAFYELNKRELESVDMDRVSRAVRRLVDAEPVIYQNDIVRRLITLLDADYVEFKSDVCQALLKWSADLGPAGNAALRVLERKMQQNVKVPKEMVELVVVSKNPGVIPFLDRLWQQAPLQWEYLYSLTGPEAESQLLKHWSDEDGVHRHSVVRLLGKVGTRSSIKPLEDHVSQADAELRVLIENALASIRSRVGE
jgi:hypothetical protein